MLVILCIGSSARTSAMLLAGVAGVENVTLRGLTLLAGMAGVENVVLRGPTPLAGVACVWQCGW